VNISKELLQKALSEDVKDTFNMISIDGDTSTNDMVSVLANGQAKNSKIKEEGPEYTIFRQALNTVTSDLSRMIAKDGEGATKLIECKVINGKTKDICKTVAKSVISSSLVKAAMFGADANWGRILCAIGYSGADVDIGKIDVSFSNDKDNTVKVCEKGFGVQFSEQLAKTILSNEEITVLINLHSGDYEATAYGCDLTYDYVKINGDYRT
jgi:glutamate N-acetyltransferase/amino-acid N-acetyltransferase